MLSIDISISYDCVKSEESNKNIDLMSLRN